MKEELNHVGRYVKRLDIYLCNNLNKVLDKYNITSSQGMILGYLDEHSDEDVSLVDLSNTFDISHPTVVGIIKRLEEKGLVKVEKSKKDSRYKIIHKTKKSDSIKEEVAQVMKENEKILKKNINEKDIETFMKVMNIMLDNLKEVQ